MRSVVAHLRAEMEARDLNPTLLARNTGLDQGNLSRVLKGEAPMVSFEVVAVVAQHLGLSLDSLVNRAVRVERSTPTPPSSSVLPSSRAR